MNEPKFKIGDVVTCGDGMPWTVVKINTLDPSVPWFSGSYFEYMVDGDSSYYDLENTPYTYFLEEDIELYVKPEPKPKTIDETAVSELFACACGGEVLGLYVLDDYVYMEIYYKNQRTIRRTLFERVRNAWYMLIGKEYKVIELIFTIGDIRKQFEDFLKKIL
jgi:hypothetical protein